jgi:hypothetical protein
MASRARLDWDGEGLLARVAEAARLSIDETTQETDDDASVSHPWVNRDGRLEANIVTARARRIGRSRLVGRIGYTKKQGFYGLFHDEGTTHEFARPTLRPAGDRSFPTLASKIRRRLS